MINITDYKTDCYRVTFQNNECVKVQKNDKIIYIV